MTVQIARRPFTVNDYARMRETGILKEDDRVELIDGEVRLMSPIGSLHAGIQNVSIFAPGARRTHSVDSSWAVLLNVGLIHNHSIFYVVSAHQLKKTLLWEYK